MSTTQIVEPSILVSQSFTDSGDEKAHYDRLRLTRELLSRLHDENMKLLQLLNGIDTTLSAQLGALDHHLARLAPAPQEDIDVSGDLGGSRIPQSRTSLVARWGHLHVKTLPHKMAIVSYLSAFVAPYPSSLSTLRRSLRIYIYPSSLPMLQFIACHFAI
ncbi:hypothetical protein FKP32DRAFT_1679350 [Trametes sanguinea]|nr:hypothetical protein FKP32DRAFT_1679350 [Trametes sanguinea]